MTLHWKVVLQYFTVMLLFFNFTQFVILEKLSILDLALSGVKGQSFQFSKSPFQFENSGV